jgi:hypothetical protein
LGDVIATQSVREEDSELEAAKLRTHIANLEALEERLARNNLA